MLIPLTLVCLFPQFCQVSLLDPSERISLRQVFKFYKISLPNIFVCLRERERRERRQITYSDTSESRTSRWALLSLQPNFTFFSFVALLTDITFISLRICIQRTCTKAHYDYCCQQHCLLSLVSTSKYQHQDILGKFDTLAPSGPAGPASPSRPGSPYYQIQIQVNKMDICTCWRAKILDSIMAINIHVAQLVPALQCSQQVQWLPVAQTQMIPIKAQTLFLQYLFHSDQLGGIN